MPFSLFASLGVGTPVTHLLPGKVRPLPGSKPYRAGGGRIQGTEHSPTSLIILKYHFLSFLDPILLLNGKLFILRQNRHERGQVKGWKEGATAHHELNS